MNHARVKELKGTGGKTTSRKAQRSGRTGDSPMASLMTSPASSANPSRVASDISDIDRDDLSEEDIEFDDTASLFTSSDVDETTAASTFNPAALIEQLQDRKHNNSETREKFIGVYLTVLRSHYTCETQDWLELAAHSLATLFLRDANRGPTATERLLNLQAYSLTVSTAYNLDIFTAVKASLQQILLEDDDDDCRVQAIYAICATTAFSSAGAQDAVLEIMEYLLEIVKSDGESIEAYDNIPVVVTALQAWCFVASYADDLSQWADLALDAFVDQLDSSDLEIQAAAGSAIAFIFEASRDHEEETGQPFELPYSAHRLLPRLRDLSKLSAKSVSRKDRRALRESLVSVATSLERGVGPYYSTALSQLTSNNGEESQVEYGYRKKLRLNKDVATIDTWALEFRINVLRVIFKGSLHRHAFANDNVQECLEDADFSSADGGEQDSEPVDKGEKTRKQKAARRKNAAAKIWD